MTFLGQMLSAVPQLASGLLVTVQLTLAAALVSFLFGHVVWWVRERPHRLLRGLGGLYVSLMRGTPSILQLFLLFFSLPLIGLGGKPMLAAVLALGLNSAAYVAEILRGSYRALASGQSEASAALGMSRFECWRHVLAPQALRASLPALVNEFTLVLKTTPLASVIAVTEMTYAGQLIVARTYEGTPVMVLVVLGYLLVCWPILFYVRRLEARLMRGRGY
ncbi:amino acid ABC transporter permease [Pseudomonas sp. NPDC089554]|uniref:amino acid ABC transporter permease n=1 Tax=Pseudomonas sp. NPDC089554 TaxID=3390653 RepID=UPI003D03B7D4